MLLIQGKRNWKPYWGDMPAVSALSDSDDFREGPVVDEQETEAFCATFLLSNVSEVDVNVARESLDWLLSGWDVVEGFIFLTKRRIFAMGSLSKGSPFYTSLPSSTSLVDKLGCNQ
jgi:hypothetical protein